MNEATIKAPLAAAVTQAQSAVGSQSEHIVLHLLYQFIVILVLTRAVVWVTRRLLGQTDVAGEILAGLVLGPSMLGMFFPGLLQAIFVPETSTIFVGLAQTGLILLMFQIGLEFEFKAQLGDRRRAVLAVSAVGILVPFCSGYLAAPWFWERLAEPRPELLPFRLFFGVSMSITAIPVLGRIFMELGLSHTRTAALTIGAAAIDDVVGWLLLGIVASLITASFQVGTLSMHLLGLLVYFFLVFVVVRPWALKKLAQRIERDRGLSGATVAAILVALFVSAAVTSNLGVFAVIGGFVVGVALHENREFVRHWHEKIGGLVNAFFLPIFFAMTGLRTDVGALADADAWLQCALVCAVAFAGKFGGAYLAARATGEAHRSALTVGVCMNTRGLMELIALNIGYELGVLPRPMFTMLVIMAIISTFITTPLIRRLMLGQEKPAVQGGIPA